MDGLIIATAIGVALFLGGTLAWKTKLPAPLVLLVFGVALGFIPTLGSVELPHDVVLFLFLPALLYWESINTSVREVRRNLRVILLSAIPLVLITAAAVAGIGLGAALTLPVAIALGAIVSPTDATAVGPITSRLPRRTRTTLRAESLINDGTALTVYAIAVAAISSGHRIDLGMGLLDFVIAYAGGIVVGIVASFIARGARRLVRGQTLLENTVSVLTPFVAYLLAQPLRASGVVAVVTCGLILTHYTPRIISARTRTQARGFWNLTSNVLNGALFLLIGLEAHRIIPRLGANPWPVLGLGVGVAFAVIGVRLLWVNTTPYLIRAIDRRPYQRTRRVTARQRLVSGWAGFRGAVSLAAALALPQPGQNHVPDYPRDELVAITLVVIVVTMVVQGLTLPAVVRFARLPADPTELDEERLAERTISETGAKYLDRVAERLGTPEDIVARVRSTYEANYATRPDGTGPAWSDGSEGELRRALIAKKREAVIRLRDAGEIDDTVLLRMQDRLDIEELRLSPIAADD